MRLLILLIAALVLFTSSPAFSETFEEVRSEFASLDTELNRVYQSAKASLPEWRFTELQKEQRDWLEYRDARAKEAAVFEGQASEGEESTNLEYWRAMGYLTETRIAIVEAWTKMDEFPREWEGVWTDGRGGTLLIMETGDREIQFFLDVVRGPTYHMGTIEGTASTNGSMARFTIREESFDEETWLSFSTQRGHLTVMGANTQFYHGARAYFDGKYIRLRQLTAEDRRTIEEGGGY